jgi:D-sedoheptulose 7-phosphate isomerase
MMPLATDYYRRLRAAVDRGPPRAVFSMVDEMFTCVQRGGCIFLMGNGASAALASHMACDLGKGTSTDLGQPADALPAQRVRVVSLVENTALLSAYGNDLSFESAFVEQLKNLLVPGDLVVGISGSGGSGNVLRALEYARAAGVRTVGLTGMMPSAVAMVDRCDLVVQVPADTIEMIEDLHLPLSHVAMKLLGARLRLAERQRP